MSESRSSRVAPDPWLRPRQRGDAMRTRDMCANPERATRVVSRRNGDLPFAVNVSRRRNAPHCADQRRTGRGHPQHRRPACRAGRTAVVVEMSEMTFMDCSGYGGLVAIRRALLERGGSLTLTNQSGNRHACWRCSEQPSRHDIGAQRRDNVVISVAHCHRCATLSNGRNRHRPVWTPRGLLRSASGGVHG